MGQDNIIHFNAIRMRVRGVGNLDMELKAFDDDPTAVLTAFTMTETTGKFLIRLCNFKSQRAALEFSTDEIDEIFRINKIVVFAKPLFTEYPG